MTVMGFSGEGRVDHREHLPVRLCRVPAATETRGLAKDMAALLGSSLAECGRPEDVTNVLGWRYSEVPVGYASSGVESLLVPLIRGGFSVVVNAHRTPSREHAMWLTAHEIGHSFFYAPGAPPRRIIPVTSEEEAFCDAFAISLLRIAKVGAGTNFFAA